MSVATQTLFLYEGLIAGGTDIVERIKDYHSFSHMDFAEWLVSYATDIEEAYEEAVGEADPEYVFEYDVTDDMGRWLRRNYMGEDGFSEELRRRVAAWAHPGEFWAPAVGSNRIDPVSPTEPHALTEEQQREEIRSLESSVSQARFRLSSLDLGAATQNAGETEQVAYHPLDGTYTGIATSSMTSATQLSTYNWLPPAVTGSISQPSYDPNLYLLASILADRDFEAARRLIFKLEHGEP